MSEPLNLDELIFEHAAGTLPEGLALFTACYMSFDPDAASRYRSVEDLGGVLLEALEPALVSEDALEQTLSRIEKQESRPLVPTAEHDEATLNLLPPPLRAYVPENVDALKWSKRGTVSVIDLPLASDTARASLIRVPPNQTIPRHTHTAAEYTLILAGGFTDRGQHYGRGDITICDGEVEHAPHADAGEDCICLAALDGPIKMTGALTRFLNPFMRF